MLEQNAVANRTLELRQVTVFAPINTAFQNEELEDGYDPNLILYHMGTYFILFNYFIKEH